MRKNVICWLGLLGLVSVAAASLVRAEEASVWMKKLPFKEATIHYTLTGTEQGQETLVVQDYGRLQAKHRVTTQNIMGTSKKIDTLQITDPDWVTEYDLVEKSGSQTANPSKIYQREYTKLSAAEKKNFEKNAKELGASLLGRFGGAIKPNVAKVLGYDCDVTTILGLSTVTVLHDTALPLRAETSVMGIKTVQEATAIDTKSPVPAAAFAAPAGIVPVRNQEAEAMMTAMIQENVATLKQPDGAEQFKQSCAIGGMGGRTGQQAMEDQELSPEEQAKIQEAIRLMQQRKAPK